MKIRIDEPRCIAAGACVMEAFEIFDQRDADGVVVVMNDAPDAHHYDAVRRAALACPAKVITAEE